jgi:hypothetical protein
MAVYLGSCPLQYRVVSPSEYVFEDDQHTIRVSRPGMSGGPVIRRSWGAHVKEQDAVSMTGGSATKFIGIYSGRLKTKEPLEAQLGMYGPLL